MLYGVPVSAHQQACNLTRAFYVWTEQGWELMEGLVEKSLVDPFGLAVADRYRSGDGEAALGNAWFAREADDADG